MLRTLKGLFQDLWVKNRRKEISDWRGALCSDFLQLCWRMRHLGRNQVTWPTTNGSVHCIIIFGTFLRYSIHISSLNVCSKMCLYRLDLESCKIVNNVLHFWVREFDTDGEAFSVTAPDQRNCPLDAYMYGYYFEHFDDSFRTKLTPRWSRAENLFFASAFSSRRPDDPQQVGHGTARHLPWHWAVRRGGRKSRPPVRDRPVEFSPRFGAATFRTVLWPSACEPRTKLPSTWPCTINTERYRLKYAQICHSMQHWPLTAILSIIFFAVLSSTSLLSGKSTLTRKIVMSFLLAHYWICMIWRLFLVGAFAVPELCCLKPYRSLLTVDWLIFEDQQTFSISSWSQESMKNTSKWALLRKLVQKTQKNAQP